MSAGSTERVDGTGARRAGGWRWLWDHIGRITGILLGLVAFAFVALLAAVGWPPAYGLVVLVVIGVAMIAVGGRITRR